MKPVVICLCVFLFSELFSCTKSPESKTVLTEPNASLTGQWKLIETLVDPGDGSGTWHSTDSMGYYIQFNADSSFDNNFINNFVPSVYSNMIKYSVINDSIINFIDSAANVYNRYYTIKEDTLNITGGCYEACGSKFIKE